jgi:hypothetical protein
MSLSPRSSLLDNLFSTFHSSGQPKYSLKKTVYQYCKTDNFGAVNKFPYRWATRILNY